MSVHLKRLLPLVATVLTLATWGCVAIYNSTFFYRGANADLPAKQLLWLGVGLLVMAISATIPAKIYLKTTRFFTILALSSLWLVLFTGISQNGMRGWFMIGSITIQPSELIKAFYILHLAQRFYQPGDPQTVPWKDDLKRAALCGLWLLPIALQPDFGTLLIYGLTAALLFFIQGGNWRRLLGLSTAGLAIGLYGIIRHPYIFKRFTAFLNPEADAANTGWHILQNLHTLASGGLNGRSLGHGEWTQTYLPNPYHDSIFASFAESVGFLGILPIFLILLFFLVFAYRRALVTENGIHRGIIIGLATTLLIQSLLHISVIVNVMPPTGLPLPFFSYGGSSMVSSCLILGMLFSFIYANTQKS